MKIFFLIFSSLLLSSVSFKNHAKSIHKERSIYRNVMITEEDNLRCMRFETRRKKVTNQACIDLSDQSKVVFEYLHGILAGFAINQAPKRILIIGLGGGILSNVMHRISPQSEIINVDIDPVVVKLAKQYFDYQENEQVKTVVQDGRVFVKRALLKQEKFDWVVLDAFNGDYIPEHLMTSEFLNEAKQLLTENGLLTANTFSTSLLYSYESVTYQHVFGDLQIFKAPTKGNRVIYATNGSQMNSFPQLSDPIKSNLAAFHVDIEKVTKRIDNQIDWDPNTPLLTDQYSPANLLKQSN